MKTLLVDNGSLEPAATLALRDLARRLSAAIGNVVEPVSLLHSNRIAPEKIDGVSAEIVESFLRSECAAGETDFVVLPLFIGPSRAIADYLPGVVEKLRFDYPTLNVKIAPTLYQTGDARMSEMLADRVRESTASHHLSGCSLRVALVDHGSPVKEVTAVRDALAVQLGDELGELVAPCSMERRAGPEYDFNEPLLETLLAREGWREATVIVAQLFLVPGRHAGHEGDVATICARAEQTSPGLRTMRTDVLVSHPTLIEILVDRWRNVS